MSEDYVWVSGVLLDVQYTRAFTHNLNAWEIVPQECFPNWFRLAENVDSRD
jgi:hypothetical protein